MAEMEVVITGDVNPLLKAFSRIRSAARTMGKEVNSVLQTPVAGEGAGAARRVGGLRGMIASGIGSGVNRLGGTLAGVIGASALVHRGLEQAKTAAETVKNAKEGGLTPSDYAALQIAQERYGESITSNTPKLVAAMTEIKKSGEVLSDTDYEKAAKNSDDLSKSLNQLNTALNAPVVSYGLAKITKGFSDFVNEAVAGATALFRAGPTDADQSKRDDADLNRANAILAGIQPTVTEVDAAAVAANVRKKNQQATATLAPFRITATDPLSRIGLYEGPARNMSGDQAKVGTELLKEARMQTEQLRKLNDNTRDL